MGNAISGFFSMALLSLGIVALTMSSNGWSGNAAMMERMAKELTDLNEKILDPLVGGVSDGYYRLKTAILREDQIAKPQDDGIESLVYGVFTNVYEPSQDGKLSIKRIDVPVIETAYSQKGKYLRSGPSVSPTPIPGTLSLEPSSELNLAPMQGGGKSLHGGD